jgi:hypothetical protein
MNGVLGRTISTIDVTTLATTLPTGSGNGSFPINEKIGRFPVRLTPMPALLLVLVILVLFVVWMRRRKAKAQLEEALPTYAEVVEAEGVVEHKLSLFKDAKEPELRRISAKI